MSINTAHANGGVLIHAGEYILLFSDKVNMEFSGQDNPLFNGQKHGRIYLTTHRMVFNSKKDSDPLQSFSFPFIAISDVELEQPVFGANYIKGKVRAQPNGNFIGEAKFKLSFKAGGAIEFGQAMLRAASMAQRNMPNGTGGYDDPPPYTPSGAWHEAPPPAYQAPPGYYGWLPTNDAFTGVPPNSVFMSDNPPPYPGIGGPAQPNVAPNGGYPGGFNQGYQGGGGPPGYPGYPQGYPGGGGAPQGYPGAMPNGHPGSAPQGYPGAPPPNYPGQPPQGYPGGQNFGWGGQAAAQQPPAGGYGGYPAAGYPGSSPSAPGGYPAPSGGAMGFSAPPNSKEEEAARSAYNPNPSPYPNPNQPNNAGFAAPPGYYEQPPAYNTLGGGDKKQQ